MELDRYGRKPICENCGKEFIWDLKKLRRYCEKKSCRQQAYFKRIKERANKSK